jgi:hypothetical protein
MEGALEDAVEAGLITMDEGEGVGVIGEGGKGGAEGLPIDGAGSGGKLAGEGSGFDGPEAAETPGGGDHLLDQAGLEVIDRPEAVKVDGEQLLEVLTGLIGEQHHRGEQAMAK